MPIRIALSYAVLALVLGAPSAAQLEKIALETVAAWQFEPAPLGGGPVDAAHTLRLSWIAGGDREDDSCSVELIGDPGTRFELIQS